MLSINFGANNGDRINQTLKYALQAVAFFSIVWTALILLLPKAFVYIFMAPTPSVLAIAPRIMRSYVISFLLLPLNIFFTYLFPIVDSAGRFHAGIGAARDDYQRRADLSFAGYGGGGCTMVYHADYRTDRGGAGGLADEKIYQTAAGPNKKHEAIKRKATRFCAAFFIGIIKEERAVR